jgi:hypothetical protein
LRRHCLALPDPNGLAARLKGLTGEGGDPVSAAAKAAALACSAVPDAPPAENQDCVSPAEAARHAPMTDRAACRLFDRLVLLGAARELSDGPPFGCPAYDRRCPPSPTARRRSLYVELIDQPPAAPWREWMLRVEAAIARWRPEK